MLRKVIEDPRTAGTGSPFDTLTYESVFPVGVFRVDRINALKRHVMFGRTFDPVEWQ